MDLHRFAHAAFSRRLHGLGRQPSAQPLTNYELLRSIPRDHFRALMGGSRPCLPVLAGQPCDPEVTPSIKDAPEGGPGFEVADPVFNRVT